MSTCNGDTDRQQPRPHRRPLRDRDGRPRSALGLRLLRVRDDVSRRTSGRVRAENLQGNAHRQTRCRGLAAARDRHASGWNRHPAGAAPLERRARGRGRHRDPPSARRGQEVPATLARGEHRWPGGRGSTLPGAALARLCSTRRGGLSAAPCRKGLLRTRATPSTRLRRRSSRSWRTRPRLRRPSTSSSSWIAPGRCRRLASSRGARRCRRLATRPRCSSSSCEAEAVTA